MPVFIINQQPYFHHIMQILSAPLAIPKFFFWPTVTSDSDTHSVPSK